jgi:muconate cycloisomerase
MKIVAIDTFKVLLPFRFSFKHSLAARAESENLIVRVRTDSGVPGYGESVPRDYVTGEHIDQACTNIHRLYKPQLIGLQLDDPAACYAQINQVFDQLSIGTKLQGASWSAVELAVLDALGQAQGKFTLDVLGSRKQERIRYGGVVPFGSKKGLLAILWFYKLLGFQTVKIKVGTGLDDDLYKVQVARKVMGPDAIIRVDANCAWSAAQTVEAANAFRPYSIASIEQPVPADDYIGLKQIMSSIEDEIVVDESLCTVEQAERLAAEKLCRAFNIRLSKVGGFCGASRMVAIAKRANLRCHLGAQVGETGILSAAARAFAMLNENFENYEGSANFFLLKRDITREGLNAGLGGWGDLSYASGNKSGWGVTVDTSTLAPTSQESAAPQLEHGVSLN